MYFIIILIYFIFLYCIVNDFKNFKIKDKNYIFVLLMKDY